MVRGTGQQIAISEFADQRARTVKHVGRKGAEVLDIGAHKQGNHRGGNGREPKGARHRGEGIAGRKWRPREGVRGRRVSRPSRAGGGGRASVPGRSGEWVKGKIVREAANACRGTARTVQSLVGCRGGDARGHAEKGAWARVLRGREEETHFRGEREGRRSRGGKRRGEQGRRWRRRPRPAGGRLERGERQKDARMGES